MMAFEEDIGTALAKACEQDNDKEAMHIARAAQIVRRHMFVEAQPFNGFPEHCQEDSVPPLLLTLVNMELTRGTQRQRPDGRGNISSSSYNCSVDKIQLC